MSVSKVIYICFLSLKSSDAHFYHSALSLVGFQAFSRKKKKRGGEFEKNTKYLWEVIQNREHCQHQEETRNGDDRFSVSYPAHHSATLWALQLGRAPCSTAKQGLACHRKRSWELQPVKRQRKSVSPHKAPRLAKLVMQQPEIQQRTRVWQLFLTGWFEWSVCVCSTCWA